MSEFVNECRREWKRLGVRDADAEEMAAELGADLQEGTAEDVLGDDAADAPSFARSWAAARGVIPRTRRGRRWAVAAALAAFAAAAIAGAVLMIASRSSETTRLAMHPQLEPVVVGPQRVWVGPPDRVLTPPAHAVEEARAAAALEEARAARSGATIVRLEAPPPLYTVEPSEDDTSETVGFVLLLVGLGGLVPLSLLALRRVARDR